MIAPVRRSRVRRSVVRVRYTVGPFNGVDRWDVAAAGPAAPPPTDRGRPGRGGPGSAAARARTRRRVTDHRGRVTPVRGARASSTPMTKTSSRVGAGVTVSTDVCVKLLSRVG